MKVTIEIDCTPIEARKFMGFPDVEPMQEAMMKELQARMSANLAKMDPEALIKQWFPLGAQGLDQMQKFFSGLASGGSKPKGPARNDG